MIIEKVENALNSLKNGQLIILVDDEDREHEGDLVGLSSQVTAEAVNFMISKAKGLLCVPVTPKKAQQLSLVDMESVNNDAYGTKFLTSLDYKDTSTGISASDRAQTIKAIANNNTTLDDFFHPGHIFPLQAEEQGIKVRRGHTEASIELAKLLDEESAYICEIIKDNGEMAREKDLERFATKYNLALITVQELSDYLDFKANNFKPLTVDLPNKYGDFRLSLYDNYDGLDHLVLSYGDIKKHDNPLIRVHSECLTGDIFHSQRCDCGEQLDEAMKQIVDYGSGAIIYLRQEGRGIGLKNKLKSYQLQEQGFNTYEANEKLGFDPDQRDYQIAAYILKNLSVDTITLMTNNPDKVEQLTSYGINILERRSLITTVYDTNQNYLKTKKELFNHNL